MRILIYIYIVIISLIDKVVSMNINDIKNRYIQYFSKLIFINMILFLIRKINK